MIFKGRNHIHVNSHFAHSVYQYQGKNDDFSGFGIRYEHNKNTKDPENMIYSIGKLKSYLIEMYMNP